MTDAGRGDIVYLVQGSRLRLDALDLGGRPLLALCYEGEHTVPGAISSLHSTTASWAEGRNILLAAAKLVAPDASYLVFCDDDVEFVRGSYAIFEDLLRSTRPLIGFPLTPKARNSASYCETLAVQKARVIDEQMYAIHTSLLGTLGVAPLDTVHDDKSWYSPAIIFEYLVVDRYDQFAHQYNEVEILNEGHVWMSGEGAYATNRGNHADFMIHCADRIRALTGNYDHTVVEQFDFQSSPEHRREINQRIRRDAAAWRSLPDPSLGE